MSYLIKFTNEHIIILQDVLTKTFRDSVMPHTAHVTSFYLYLLIIGNQNLSRDKHLSRGRN